MACFVVGPNMARFVVDPYTATCSSVVGPNMVRFVVGPYTLSSTRPHTEELPLSIEVLHM